MQPVPQETDDIAREFVDAAYSVHTANSWCLCALVVKKHGLRKNQTECINSLVGRLKLSNALGNPSFHEFHDISDRMHACFTRVTTLHFDIAIGQIALTDD